MSTPYHSYVSSLASLARGGKQFPLGGFERLPRPELAPDAPKVLIFSPHPDDECIIGALPLRFMRQAGYRVVNVAVTQGSNKARQAERWWELANACDYLGFDLVGTTTGGLERINAKTREDDPAHWASCVEVIARIIAEHRPAVACFPHDRDWNSTHIGVHHLLVDALGRQDPSFVCHVLESEFWGAMWNPNLVVEVSEQDLGDMMAALSFHVGEVERNPYHLLVPAWMQDNVRRGAEVAGGQGGVAPDYTFATLYRWRQWRDGALHYTYEGGRNLGLNDNPTSLF